MTYDIKPSNPKDIIGSSKLPLELVPDTAVAHMALAFLEGALKYGRYNWRIAGVRSSIYVAAARRHLAKWWNGEHGDPNTGVHHLASAMACMAIMLDAYECDKLVDDRPPMAPVEDLVDALASDVANLKRVFADHAPRQWTIDDTVTVVTCPTDEAYEAAGWRLEGNEWLPGPNAGPLRGSATKTDAAYEAAVCLRYSASPAAGVTLGPYATQEALDKALYRWTEYRDVLGETEDQREARLRREQDQ